MRNFLILSLLIFYWLTFSAGMCTKDIVYGRDFYTNPIHETFSNDKASIMVAIQKTLDHLGYTTQVVDESKGEFVTGWQPVEAESHYVKLFDRRDYGAADGAYYELTVDLSDVGSKTKVAVGTKVKSIVGKLETTKRVENKFLDQLRDNLRSPNIELTNVEVRNK